MVKVMTHARLEPFKINRIKTVVTIVVPLALIQASVTNVLQKYCKRRDGKDYASCFLSIFPDTLSRSCRSIQCRFCCDSISVVAWLSLQP